MKEQFIEFLKENEAYRDYIKNLKNHRGLTLDEYFNRRCADEESVLMDAFVWAETKEGYEYWKNLNKKWEEHHGKEE